jgi:hypothetical protein
MTIDPTPIEPATASALAPATSTLPTTDTSQIWWMCVIFAVVFGVGGIIAGYFTILKPWQRLQAARAWPVVSCHIVSAQVITVESSPGTTSDTGLTSYSAEVVYEYEWEGRTLRSKTVHVTGFAHQSSSDRESWDTYVAQFPASSKNICRVNPADPAQAVLDVSFHWQDFLGGGIMTIVFLGVALLFWAIRRFV